MKKISNKTAVKHETTFLADRGHEVDLLVLPTLQKLWVFSINTFYSCQGGIDWISKDKVYYTKAYVMVHMRDMVKACKLLSDCEPMIEIADQTINPGLVCIRFTPCKEARGGIPVKYFERGNSMEKISSKKLKNRKA